MSPARRGAALLLALVLLAVGATLATAAAAAGRDAQRGAHATLAATRARWAALGALAWTVRHWPGERTLALRAGETWQAPVRTAAGTATVRALRLDAHRVALVADGESPLPGDVAGGARRVLALARLRRMVLDPPAALVSGGPVTLAAGARLGGDDATPDGWSDCTGPAAARAALAVGDPAHAPPGVTPVTVTPLASDATLHDRFGDVDRAALARRAAVAPPPDAELSPTPRSADGACATDGTSLGEPWRGAGAVAACVTASPVVHLRGRTTLRGPARVQGVLVVDGDLRVEGTVHVVGALLVRGALRAEGAALRVEGAVLVRHDPAVTTAPVAVALGAGSALRWSRCAVERASLAASPMMGLGRRSWLEVTR